MKKIISFSALFLGCFMLAGTAAHAITVNNAQAKAGDRVTIPEVTGHGPGLNFDPSPNNWMSEVSTDSMYALQSMNAQAPDTQRMEYGVWYNSTGYFQKINPDMAGTAVALTDFTVTLDTSTDLTVNPYAGGDWTAIGGGS